MRLRRPAVLSFVEGPFVPDRPGAMLEEGEARWRDLCDGNPAYFDGRLLHVMGVHRNGHGGASLHVTDCAYRYHAVQDDGFDLGVRALGVKGITMRAGRVLVGRRAATVARYNGLWEFAPGGAVEPGRTPVATVLDELAEETGLRAAREPTPIALLDDPVTRTWEIVFRIDPGDGICDARPTTVEYDDMAWCAPDDLPRDLTPLARRMRPLLGHSASSNVNA